MDFGKAISRERKRAGMAQGELGKACGWGDNAQSRISNYERNHRRPSLDDLLLMAKAMGITLSRLVDESPPPDRIESREHLSELDPSVAMPLVANLLGEEAFPRLAEQILLDKPPI